jgi:hypothetical protein
MRGRHRWIAGVLVFGLSGCGTPDRDDTIAPKDILIGDAVLRSDVERPPGLPQGDELGTVTQALNEGTCGYVPTPDHFLFADSDTYAVDSSIYVPLFNPPHDAHQDNIPLGTACPDQRVSRLLLQQDDVGRDSWAMRPWLVIDGLPVEYYTAFYWTPEQVEAYCGGFWLTMTVCTDPYPGPGCITQSSDSYIGWPTIDSFGTYCSWHRADDPQQSANGFPGPGGRADGTTYLTGAFSGGWVYSFYPVQAAWRKVLDNGP